MVVERSGGVRVGRAVRLGAAAALGYAAWRALARPARPLAGEVALVTGGSRGLGLLIARELARQRCRIAICARDERELARAREDLERRGAEVAAYRCDVAQREQVDALVRHVTDRFGRVDILVNNASIIQVGPVECMTVRDFEQAMAVNYWGTVYATLAVLPQMRRRGSGRIVNITSIGGVVAVPHLLPYDAAKFAARGFSEGLRAELSDTGITVTTIVPGLMRTGSPVNAFFKGDAAKEYTWFSLGDATPLTAMSAGRAARRIVEAIRRGEAEVTLSWQARLLGLIHDLFPGATTELLGRVSRMLPSGERGTERNVRGMQLATALSPSPLTVLMNRAARRNNQFGGAAEPAPEHARKIGLAA